jgi:hypothetical protein
MLELPSRRLSTSRASSTEPVWIRIQGDSCCDLPDGTKRLGAGSERGRDLGRNAGQDLQRRSNRSANFEFNDVVLNEGEDVAGLAKRLYGLVIGLPEAQGVARDILLMQRLKDALPLALHGNFIRNTQPPRP